MMTSSMSNYLNPGTCSAVFNMPWRAPCLGHKPSETIEPRTSRVFLDTVAPKQYAISPKDTSLAMLMHNNLKYRF